MPSRKHPSGTVTSVTRTLVVGGVVVSLVVAAVTSAQSAHDTFSVESENRRMTKPPKVHASVFGDG